MCSLPNTCVATFARDPQGHYYPYGLGMSYPIISTEGTPNAETGANGASLDHAATAIDATAENFDAGFKDAVGGKVVGVCGWSVGCDLPEGGAVGMSTCGHVVTKRSRISRGGEVGSGGVQVCSVR